MKNFHIQVIIILLLQGLSLIGLFIIGLYIDPWIGLGSFMAFQTSVALYTKNSIQTSGESQQ